MSYLRLICFLDVVTDGVGVSLSTKVPLDKLSQDVQALFSTNGPCHVKIKQDRFKGLPGAFVQFEVSAILLFPFSSVARSFRADVLSTLQRVQDAMLALARSDCTQLHGRYLRIEKARGRSESPRFCIAAVLQL